MNLILKKSKRILAVAMVLVLLVSGVVHTLSTPALAAGTTYNLYRFIAANCYSDQPTAVKILTSDALVDAGSILLGYPESDLLSVSDGRLVGGKHPVFGLDGRVHSVWVPKTYTIDGVVGAFYDDTDNVEVAVSAPLSVSGPFHAQVLFELDTGLDENMLNLPATLAREAAGQITALDHLTSHDKSWLEQMNDSRLKILYDILDHDSAEHAGRVMLSADPSDAEKNAALKSALREAIAGMRTDCCLGNGSLTLFDLLIWYEEEGLIHYYQNGETYLSELDLLERRLNALLAAEERDGVALTAADKEYALERLVEYAKRCGSIQGDVSLDFAGLRDDVRIAGDLLTAPNKRIDHNDEKALAGLVEILEQEATRIGESQSDGLVQRWEPVVKAYGSSLILTKTVDADLKNTGGATFRVDTESAWVEMLTNAGAGDTICIVSDISMTQDVRVGSAVAIKGAEKLNDAGHMLTLTSPEASLRADGPLKVDSGVEGYAPVREPNSNTYTLAEVARPKISGEIAGVKSEIWNGIRYLFLDLDPVNGMTLDALRASTCFEELAEYAVEFSIEENAGGELVKTGDRLMVRAFNPDGRCVALINYVVIVMGDTNCNGKVNTSDAAVIRSISMGKEYPAEVRMAADVNFSGTTAAPKVNSSDVSFSMAKWFAWDQKKYVSNLK